MILKAKDIRGLVDTVATWEKQMNKKQMNMFFKMFSKKRVNNSIMIHTNRSVISGCPCSTLEDGLVVLGCPCSTLEDGSCTNNCHHIHLKDKPCVDCPISSLVRITIGILENIENDAMIMTNMHKSLRLEIID